jgi:SNF2 family DNA or RNA helicase
LALHDPAIINLKKDKTVTSKDKKDNLELILSKWQFKDNSKLEVCNSLLHKYLEEENRKVILWSGHPYVIESLKTYFAKYNPLIIHGEMKFKDKTKERDDILELFKKSPEHNLLIASYLVLKTAVNITEATRSIYFDKSYDFIPYSQSSRRNYRIGSKETVIETSLILEDTLEVVQDYRLKQKANLNNILLRRDSLSKEEWKSLFLGNTDLFQ